MDTFGDIDGGSPFYLLGSAYDEAGTLYQDGYLNCEPYSAFELNSANFDSGGYFTIECLTANDESSPLGLECSIAVTVTGPA